MINEASFYSLKVIKYKKSGGGGNEKILGFH